MLATALFLGAGLWGYDSLMRGAGGEPREVQVIETKILTPTSRPAAGNAGAWNLWGFTVELTVSAISPYSAAPHGVVHVRPLLRTRSGAEALARKFRPGTVIRVHRSLESPADFEIADSSFTISLLIPVLLSILGVLSLALTLRFSPQHYADAPVDFSGVPAGATSLKDLLQPKT